MAAIEPRAVAREPGGVKLSHLAVVLGALTGITLALVVLPAAIGWRLLSAIPLGVAGAVVGVLLTASVLMFRSRILRRKRWISIDHLTSLEGEPCDGSLGLEHLPLVVDFWAEWCVPCKMMDPVVAELAARFDRRLRFAKLDVGLHPEVARQLGVLALPSLILFFGGKERVRVVGAASMSSVTDRLERALTQPAGSRSREVS